MTNLQASIGFSQLQNANEILKERKAIESLYKHYLSKNKYVIFGENEKVALSVNWIFTLIIKKKISYLIKFLDKFGVES